MKESLIDCVVIIVRSSGFFRHSGGEGSHAHSRSSPHHGAARSAHHTGAETGRGDPGRRGPPRGAPQEGLKVQSRAAAQVKRYEEVVVIHTLPFNTLCDFWGRVGGCVVLLMGNIKSATHIRQFFFRWFCLFVLAHLLLQYNGT